MDALKAFLRHPSGMAGLVLLVIVLNLLTDLIYRLIDPRMTTGAA